MIFFFSEQFDIFYCCRYRENEDNLVVRREIIKSKNKDGVQNVWYLNGKTSNQKMVSSCNSFW